MEQEYFDFLLSFLDESEDELPSIFDSHHLLWKLHHIEFRYSAMMDRNRDMDGREWRNRYGGKLSPWPSNSMMRRDSTRISGR